MIVYKELGAELRIQFYPCCVHTGDEDFTLIFYTGEYEDSEEFFNTKCVKRRKDELKDIKGNMATVYLEESELNKMGDGVLKIACNYGDAIKHTSQNYYIKSPEYDYSIKYIYTQDDMDAAQEGFKNSLQEKNVEIHFDELGGTITPDSGYSGLSKVTYDANEVRQFWYDGGVAAQKMKLSGATFTANGDYTRDDGWSAVSVNIPIQNRKDVTDLGTLKDVDEGRFIYPDQGYTAIGAVYAKVDPDASGVANLRKMAFDSGKTAQEKEDAAKLTTTAITENGTYTAPYGFSSVDVNVASNPTVKASDTDFYISSTKHQNGYEINSWDEGNDRYIKLAFKGISEGFIFSNKYITSATSSVTLVADEVKLYTNQKSGDTWVETERSIADTNYIGWYTENNAYSLENEITATYGMGSAYTVYSKEGYEASGTGATVLTKYGVQFNTSSKFVSQGIANWEDKDTLGTLGTDWYVGVVFKNIRMVADDILPIKLQAKSVGTSGLYITVVTADSGYDGLSSVTINPRWSYIAGHEQGYTDGYAIGYESGVATASGDTARREGWEEGRTYLDIKELATNTTKYEFTLCQGGTMQLNSNKWTTFTVDGVSLKSDQATVSAQNSDKKIVLEGVESIASASNISINGAVKDITITCNNSNIWNIDLDNSTSGNITVNGNVNIVRDGGLGSPCNAQLDDEYIIFFNGNVRKMEDSPIAYGIDDGIYWTYYFNANFTYPPILSEAFFAKPNGYGYKYKITSKYGGDDWETGDDWRYAFDYYNFGTTHHWTFNSID